MQLLTATLLVLSLTGVALSDEPPAVEGWGVFIDPDNDCRVAVTDDQLSITVPGKLHDLNQRNGMNAPRVVREFTGDFELSVKVSGPFEPGPESDLSSGLRFNSAGLLLWHDEANYVRLEQNVFVTGSRKYSFPPLCEIFSEGRYKGINKSPTDEPYFTDNTTWLRLIREGDYFTPAVSHDGNEWEELPRVEVILPDALFVGVSAINTSKSPHTATFEDLVIKKH